MKIGVLTSSRADFGIYLPLLTKLQTQTWVDFKIICFGTHLSHFHGYTANQITEAGFDIAFTVESMLLSDTPNSVATAIGLTITQFSSFWKEHGSEFDIVFCLGDRFEMFAAVMAGVPFQVKFAHIHGGETTLGAIDNVFRHAITQASSIHFASTLEYKFRIEQMLDEPQYVYWVGALSLDNISNLQLMNQDEFYDKWGVDVNKPTVLTTFHPETVSAYKNKKYTQELIDAISDLARLQFVITMPNTDTDGSVVREMLVGQLGNKSNVFLIENMGSKGYFSAINFCNFLLGNTSSGIIEAASFGKYVINLGDRQKGRMAGQNIINVEINKDQILTAVKQVEELPKLTTEDIYFNGGAAKKIVSVLSELENNSETNNIK